MSRPRLFINHIAELDWLVALEFGRIDDGQPSENWEGFSNQLGFLHDGPGGRLLGFKIVDFSELDLDAPDAEALWRKPRFDVPVLGLSDVPPAEIVLATRALFGDRPSINRVYFNAAAGSDGEQALGLWLSCLQCGDSMAHFGIGYTLYELGRFSEAYRHLRHYTEIAPASPWSWCWFGRAAEALGETLEARRAYEHALELEGDGAEETDAVELLDELLTREAS